MLLGKVSDGIRTRLLTEQEKRNQRQPTLKLTGLGSVPLAAVEANEKVPQYEPGTRITQKGNYFFVRLPSVRAMEGLMMMNGRTLNNGLAPKFARLEVKMELEEIFSWVAMDLKAQERSSTIAKVSRAWPTVEESKARPKIFSYEVYFSPAKPNPSAGSSASQNRPLHPEGVQLPIPHRRQPPYPPEMHPARAL